MKKVIFTTLLTSLTFASFSHSAFAINFQPGRIINDGIFVNKNAMSLDDIRNFINAKGVSCMDGEAPCLKNFSEGGRSAAQIIYDASQANNINPQALIVTLQKETGLLTKSAPGAWRYRTATGYGCPDKADCEGLYYGFTNQIDNTANMYHKIMINSPNWYSPYVVGNNYVAWHPDFWDTATNSWVDRCGGTNVYIENRATQALYSYTPYQPNAAALAAGYGDGDACSSYGNRNFFNYFRDWFGNPTIEGRVYIEQLDSVADIDGKVAKIGFRLNSRPDYPVTISFRLSDTTIAGVVGGISTLTIQPGNWNNPSQNVVMVYGKDNGSNQTNGVTLETTDIASPDPQFDLLDGSDLGDPFIVIQGGSRDVYRLYSQSLDRHIYTSRISEVTLLQSRGYKLDGPVFNACEAGSIPIVRVTKGGASLLLTYGSSEYNNAIANGYWYDSAQFSVSSVGRVPVYRLRSSNNNYLYTSSQAERDYAVTTYGYTYEGTAFYACRPADKPIFRLINTVNNNHFYTANPAERDAAGAGAYRYQDVSFYTSPDEPSSIPVYRLFSKVSNSHFYTISTNERDLALSNGYASEGIGFSIPPGGVADVYRLYSAKKRDHFYTLSVNEATSAGASGYSNEGVGFKAP